MTQLSVRRVAREPYFAIWLLQAASTVAPAASLPPVACRGISTPAWANGDPAESEAELAMLEAKLMRKKWQLQEATHHT